MGDVAPPAVCWLSQASKTTVTPRAGGPGLALADSGSGRADLGQQDHLLHCCSLMQHCLPANLALARQAILFFGKRNGTELRDW